MNRSLLLGLGSFVLALFLVFGMATRAEAKPQTNCPVRGEPIDRDVYTDYEGLRIYFCCPDCMTTFKANPQTYLKKLSAEGVELETTPAPHGHGAEGAAEHHGHTMPGM
jgi:YHS domain-containing protein